MKETYARIAPATVAVLSSLFLVDMFLDWRSVDINGGMIVSVNTSTTGWNGWGWVAGIAALALLFYALLELSGYIESQPGTEIPPVVLGIVMCLSSLAEFHNVATVNVLNAVVAVSREWPATVGVVLATATALVAVGRLLVSGPAFSGRSHPAH